MSGPNKILDKGKMLALFGFDFVWKRRILLLVDANRGGKRLASQGHIFQRFLRKSVYGVSRLMIASGSVNEW